MQTAHDAQECARMREDAIYVAPNDPPPCFERSRSLRSVLLTGPTGFFGPFLLDSLLRQTTADVVVLVRGADATHCQDRVAAAYARAGLGLLDTTRLRFIPGDLSAHRLGLSDQAWSELCRDVNAILHNGAWVNYLLSYDALRSHNVEGTRRLLDLACTGKAKSFHLISSTFIYGWSTKKTLWEDDHHLDMSNLDFGYAQSKWTAEHLVHSAAAQGLPAHIYRPSLITPTASGAGSRDDIAIRVLAFMIKYGVAPRALNQLSFLPADVAADNIVAILNATRTTPGRASAFQVTADDYYNIMDVARIITAQLGCTFRYVPLRRFVDEMNRLCRKDDLLYPLRAFFTRSLPRLEAMRDKRYDNRQYRAARLAAGDVSPEPALAQTVAWLVQFMQDEGLIPSSVKTADGVLAPSPEANVP
jgi:thioester reductase-like protein